MSQVGRVKNRGAWVTHLAESLTLDFSSGYDLLVHEFKPHIGLCANSVEPSLESLSLSLSLCLSPTCMLALSLAHCLKINFKKIKNTIFLSKY